MNAAASRYAKATRETASPERLLVLLFQTAVRDIRAGIAALEAGDAALVTVSTSRATLGAAGNRFESAIANIQSFSEALSAANSRIKDVDVAEETSRLARSQILQQAGVSVLAQANQTPQLALKLLG